VTAIHGLSLYRLESKGSHEVSIADKLYHTSRSLFCVRKHP